MFAYYCKKCSKFCDFDEEIELRELFEKGDWREFHIECDSLVEVSLKEKIE